MRTDYATLSRTAQTLKANAEAKRLDVKRAHLTRDPETILAARAEAIRADKKYQQAVRVALGGIRRIARRGPNPQNHK